MRAAAPILVLAAVACPGASAQGSSPGEPRAGAPSEPPPTLLEQVSAADRRDWRRGIRIADRTESVRDQRARRPALRSTSFAREGRCCLSVWYSAGGEERAVVKVNLATGAILEQWTGHQVGWAMARGYEGQFGRKFNAPWVWIPLGLLFLAPFVDLRRPFRLLHLDLLALLGFGVSHVLFNRGEIETSVPLVYPVLVYLLVRMLIAGFRPREGRGPLVPHLGSTALIVGIVVLAAFRIGLNIVDSNVLDIGYAGVIGADHIVHGEELYDGDFATDPAAGDTYGPVNYAAYIPFVETLGWSGHWDALPAAHGAAIAFDLLTLLALMLLGRRLRAGPEGRTLALALGFAWLAYPYSLFCLSVNSNDALMAAAVLFAVLALSSAPARGAALALGAATKLAPLALAPLLAAGRGLGRPRDVVLFVLAFAGVLAAVFAPFVPPAGLDQLYDRTIGFQVDRESPFSLWGLHPGLYDVQTAVKIAAVNLAALLFLVPARRTRPQVAALAAAVLIAIQLTVTHWFYAYVVWFAPLVLVALFAAHATGDRVRGSRAATT